MIMETKLKVVGKREKERDVLKKLKKHVDDLPILKEPLEWPLGVFEIGEVVPNAGSGYAIYVAGKLENGVFVCAKKFVRNEKKRYIRSEDYAPLYSGTYARYKSLKRFEK